MPLITLARREILTESLAQSQAFAPPSPPPPAGDAGERFREAEETTRSAGRPAPPPSIAPPITRGTTPAQSISITTQAAPANQFLDSLVKYIPAETIAIYLAFLPAVNITGTSDTRPGWALFIFMLILTVIIYLLATIVEDRKANPKPTVMPLQRPHVLWNIVASLIAFTVYALSIPGNPAFYPNNVPLVSAVLISPLTLLISTMLTLIGQALGLDQPPVDPPPVDQPPVDPLPVDQPPISAG